MDQTTATAALVAAFAETYAFDPASIRSVCLDLERLREQGVLLRVEVRGISQFWRRPVWEELGVHKDDVTARVFTLGASALFEKKLVNKIESLENRFRQWLDRFSYDVLGFRPFRLLLIGDGSRENPERSAYWSFRAKHEELLAEWNSHVADLLSDTNYQEAKRKLAADYADIARREAYPKLMQRIKTRYRGESEKRNAALAAVGDIETFVNRVVARRRG